MIPPGFKQIWAIDCEFYTPEGEKPVPICIVCRELFSGRLLRIWLWGKEAPRPPFAVGPDVLVIAYFATAEWSVYLALGWPLPVRVVDLYAEFRWLLSGIKSQEYGQLDAMAYFKLPTMDARRKDAMRALCMTGGPFGPEEQRRILDYCQQDVDGLAALFREMVSKIQWPQAIARGRYTAALAHPEADGVPLNMQTYTRLREYHYPIRRHLVRAGATCGIYDADGGLDTEAFARYLTGQNIEVPRTPTGRVSTREEVLEELVEMYPQLRPFHELRTSLGQLKDDGGLSVGRDGRNRTMLRPFGTSTGRNAPSTTKFVYGKSTAYRHLIKPRPGMALGYVDWAQQEFGIVAVLSSDPNMLAAYLSGDVYFAMGKLFGMIPQDAPPGTYGHVRDLFKVVVLAVNYGQGALALSRRLGKPLAFARQILDYHRQVFKRYWEWAQTIQNQSQITDHLYGAFGWRLVVTAETNIRSVRNFPAQCNGSEMLRLAVCLAVERGVKVVAPVHDALLVEAPTPDIDHAVAVTRRAMEEASTVVLDGFALRTDVKVVKSPKNYTDKRGTNFWLKLMDVLAKVSGRMRE
jgi:hypothetical protein